MTSDSRHSSREPSVPPQSQTAGQTRNLSEDEDEVYPPAKRSRRDPLVRIGKHAARTIKIRFRSNVILNYGSIIFAKLARGELAIAPIGNKKYDLCCELLDLIPDGQEKLKDGAWVIDASVSLDQGGNEARSDDVSGVKLGLIEWIAAIDPSAPRLSTTKARRGFHHPVCGRLLCPPDYDWNDPDTQKDLQDEVKKPTVEEFPPFLYYNYTIQGDDEMVGLCMSDLLIKAARHIFIGPSAAEEGGQNRSTRSGNAELNGMTAMTKPAIAYVATIVRFGLSSDDRFGKKGWPVYNFYDELLSLLDNPAVESEVDELLDYWNEQVFKSVQAEAPSTGGTRARILAGRV